MNKIITLILVNIVYLNSLCAKPIEMNYLKEDKIVGFIDIEVPPLIKGQEKDKWDAGMYGEQEMLLEKQVHLIRLFFYIVEGRKICKLCLDEKTYPMESAEYDKEGEFYIFGKAFNEQIILVAAPEKAFQWNRIEKINVTLVSINK